MKKIISLTLALAIVLSMSICAFAAETTLDSVNNSGKLNLEGKILDGNDVISVVMPTTLTFQVGTTKEASATLAADKTSEGVASQTGNVFASFVGSEGTITSNSTCPVTVSLAAVTDDNTNPLLSKLNIYLTGPDSTKKEALSATAKEAVLAKLAAKGTATIELTGAEAFGTDDSQISLPVSNSIKIVTTLKVAKTAE